MIIEQKNDESLKPLILLDEKGEKDMGLSVGYLCMIRRMNWEIPDNR